MIFETERLAIRKLHENDSDLFFELMSNPNVMMPIPQKVFSRIESNRKLSELILLEKSRKLNIWGFTKTNSHHFIGFCGFLKNNENEDEIAYRLIERYWGHGFGTEIAKGLIEYGFDKLNLEKITADVHIENEKSSKILKKFLNPVKEFYNKKDNCIDRRYEIYKTDYNNKKFK